MKANKDPVFGWPGSITRFSWSTTKDLLEKKGDCAKVEWAEEEDEEGGDVRGYFGGGGVGQVGGWYGRSVGMDF